MFRMDILKAAWGLSDAPFSAPDWFRRAPKEAQDEGFSRSDASESVFIERQLLGVRAKLYELRWPELTADDWIPQEAGGNIDPGMNHWTYQWLEHYGDAPKLHTGMSERGPLAEVRKREATPIPFVSKTGAYDYTLQDLRNANFANFNLTGEKAKADRMRHEMERDERMLVGTGTAAYEYRTGLFKLANTLTYTLTVGAGLSASWLFKTPDEIVFDMNAIADYPTTNSNGIESPDTMGLPLAAYNLVANRRMGDGDSTTILEHFLKVRRGRKPGFTVKSHWRLDTAGTNGRIICYERNPERVARLESIRFEQGQPQVEGFRTITDTHSRDAGVYSAYPKSIVFADGCMAAS